MCIYLVDLISEKEKNDMNYGIEKSKEMEYRVIESSKTIEEK